MRGARREVALRTKSEKDCSQISRSYAALQSRSVKDPAAAFSHNQDPEPTFWINTLRGAAIPRSSLVVASETNVLIFFNGSLRLW